MREAARNEGGGAGIGMGMGVGIGLGQTMAQSMTESMAAQPITTTDSPMEKLSQLKKLHEANLITAEEYAAKKKIILDSL